MRVRLAVLLAVVALVLLMLPSVSQAAFSWDGTSVNFRDASPYVYEKSVGIDYYGTVTYSSQDRDLYSSLFLMATGDVVLPHSGIIDPTQQGHEVTSNGLTRWYQLWCSGEADLPLTRGDGVKRVAVRFQIGGFGDLPGSISPSYSGTVILDTHGPKTVAPYALACKKGGYVTVSYQVNDSLSPKASVTLRVSSTSGKTLKTATIGKQDTGKLLTYLWKCPLGKGKYKYSILATDLAGNKASKAGTNTLTVR